MTKRLMRISILSLTLAALQVCHCADAAEPEVIGSEQFVQQVRQALLLLKTRDAGAYLIVENYIGRIQEGERSGMWAYKTPPTYEMSRVTSSYSLTWTAATIAHDSCHSQLYHEYKKTHPGRVPDAVWSGTASEQRCVQHQLLVMEHIGATKGEINHVKKLADGRYVKDRETWQDYEKRNW